MYYLQEDIGIQVVDGVVEDIRLGLEVFCWTFYVLYLKFSSSFNFVCNDKINMAKYNQRRVSMIKYIGELYNYRMVESSIIFKTLYILITYGVSYDRMFI